jgi:hypothetical protein
MLAKQALVSAVVIVGAAIGAVDAVRAQSYPTRPITFVSDQRNRQISGDTGKPGQDLREAEARVTTGVCRIHGGTDAEVV